MKIAVASGKGGTGKTTISTNLASALDNTQLLDCDVEEPNSYIFIKPEFKKTKEVSIPIPEINQDQCNACGKCVEVCAFNALAKIKDNVLVFSDLCHGCGSCTYFCPTKAIKEVDRKIGVVEIGSKNGLDFIQGKLDIGQPMAPPLIKAVKKNINPDKINIIDAPPGTSCPVISAITGTDFCLLVTEPTPFGLNDLKLAVEVLRKIKIPFGVVINRFDLGDDKTEKYCQKEQIPILMRLPFSKRIATVYSKGTLIIEELPEYKKLFVQLFLDIKKELHI
ncbi:MAG: ATP-binding protein [Candidatus Nanoarchaeia archaeon]|nr:ATP-binding protein [Candidatus Nanoarchaeia archaeon]